MAMITKAIHFDPPLSPDSYTLAPSAQIHVLAPPSHVFDILVDGSKWPEWNTFCPAVDMPGDAKSFTQNMAINLHVRMDPEKPSSLRKQPEIVTEVTRGEANAEGQQVWRAIWRANGLPRFMLRADRTNELIEVDVDGRKVTHYTTWECMGGPTAMIVKRMFGETLQTRFEDWANDLKAYAEKTWREQHENKDTSTNVIP